MLDWENYQLPIPSATLRPLPITNYQFPIPNCQLSTVNCLFFHHPIELFPH
ncbi:MAG: hypothetical protein HC942_22065 [Microcoleus sp. SU_5_6]|nr:hypothetical protein [Microcoleus sp. SU_5_6]